KGWSRRQRFAHQAAHVHHLGGRGLCAGGDRRGVDAGGALRRTERTERWKGPPIPLPSSVVSAFLVFLNSRIRFPGGPALAAAGWAAFLHPLFEVRALPGAPPTSATARADTETACVAPSRGRADRPVGRVRGVRGCGPRCVWCQSVAGVPETIGDSPV